MKNVYKQKRQEGFTIIEVLIVLAIAALILLIVFLAVPSLQRNARNTQRKSDAANLASAITNFEGNNNGALPTAIGYSTADRSTSVLYCRSGTPATAATWTAAQDYGTDNKFGCTTSNNNFDSAKLGYYKPDDNKIFFNSTAAAPGVVATTVAETATQISTNSMVVMPGYQCDSTNTGLGTKSNRSVALFYVAETSSGNGNLQCVQA